MIPRLLTRWLSLVLGIAQMVARFLRLETLGAGILLAAVLVLLYDASIDASGVREMVRVALEVRP